MRLFKKLFGKKSYNQKEEYKPNLTGKAGNREGLLKQPTKSEIERAQKMYTFSSIFPTEEIMKRSIKIIHESDDVKKNEDELER